MGAKGGYIGLQKAKLALLDDNNKVITSGGLNDDGDGIYTVTVSEDLGANAASLTGLAGSTTSVYGNNTRVKMSVGKAQPSIALTVNAFNYETLNKILGRKDLGNGKFNFEGDPVNLAMAVYSNTDDGGDIIFGFYKGIMTPGDLSLATDQDTENRVTDALTYTPLGNEDGDYGVIAWSDADGYEESDVLNTIFPQASSDTTTTTTVAASTTTTSTTTVA
ncbi:MULTISPECIES: phage tail protein [Lactiplantibacillus]|jgi:hypothetical protein|uniref:Phage tail protein n=1 Tax=Lactiplantibacillus pentosus TaxID=1589 RepID=A0AAP5Q4B5_LACPE|nr:MULTISPECIES: phage tail protein [Lactiplantibacillus]MBQ0836234.1 hypothetical protein [Lactiplantibacillus pentosus]MBU7461194.1 hypothetical protein [Lactiplantibacillus pentosus]MBU7463134.1 hypothetical protein [Lactiplantibacillus pentosus]MBU7476964.1 hypothetical protein [Lactiplantibacillus pentosus]MBU7483888.1 hypothetical protein [Lactiplantibacillus sp. 30.2.29]